MTILAIGMGMVAYKTTGITPATPAAPAPVRLTVPPMNIFQNEAKPSRLILPPSKPLPPVAGTAIYFPATIE
jgi:hypothetical protein